MLGKFNAYSSYMVNSFKVYIVHRFPGSKLPLWGMTATCLTLGIVSQRLNWKLLTKGLNYPRHCCNSK